MTKQIPTWTFGEVTGDICRDDDSEFFIELTQPSDGATLRIPLRFADDLRRFADRADKVWIEKVWCAGTPATRRRHAL